MPIDLGINIDHVATLRNARGEGDPSLVELAAAAQRGGADSFTMHLREDRRHIVDDDLFDIRKHMKLPINFEMALTDEMIEIALELKPRSVCIVPEKREEVTTEGGLNVQAQVTALEKALPRFLQAEIEPFLFIEADAEVIKLAAKLGVTGIEVHTGSYAHAFANNFEKKRQLQRLAAAAEQCKKLALRFHAGHGLNYANIAPVLELTELREVNIGHAVIAQALLVGLETAVSQMKRVLTK